MVSKLSSAETLNFLIIVSIVFISARLLGELFRKFNQPAVIGEILAGVILGPSLIGTYVPDLFHSIFLSQPKSYSAFDGLANIGIIILMFVAGLEVELGKIRKYGRHAASISLAGLLFPFTLGFATVWFFHDLLFPASSGSLLIPAMFFGTALSITALSVCAKILMDLNILKTKIGMLTLTAAMIDDFFGWILFSIILQLMNKSEGNAFGSVGMVLVFVALVMTAGRWFINKALQWSNNNLNQPGGSLTAGIIFCLIGALVTEYLGIRGVFGAFLMGVAVGDSKHFTEKNKNILHQFITNIFAPLFFASIGLRVNFVANFDLTVVLFILTVACIAKLVGAGIGARVGGLNKNESLAVAFGMNARGSMEIVLGLLALQAKIIDERIFVGLVVMTMVTILMAGPMMKVFLLRHEVKHGEVVIPKKMRVIVNPEVESIV
ncbi:MAG: cation:proton antiporter [Chitinophagales bacterium]|nr:cation:proton antiporter [Chitinophagales bacterium]